MGFGRLRERCKGTRIPIPGNRIALISRLLPSPAEIQPKNLTSSWGIFDEQTIRRRSDRLNPPIAVEYRCLFDQQDNRPERLRVSSCSTFAYYRTPIDILLDNRTACSTGNPSCTNNARRT